MGAVNDQTPLTWLWNELSRRYGSEIADQLHQEFNRRRREYQRETRIRLQRELEERNERLRKEREMNTLQKIIEGMESYWQESEILPEDQTASQLYDYLGGEIPQKDLDLALHHQIVFCGDCGHVYETFLRNDVKH